MKAASTVVTAVYKNKTPEPTPYEKVFDMALGYWKSRCLAVAAELELADLLSEGSKSLETLAAETKTDSLSLFRMLRALAGEGIFRQVSPKVFANTPMSECLRKADPDSLWAFTHMTLSRGQGHVEPWIELLDALRTGEVAFDRMHGQSFWSFLQRNPEKAAVFNAAMRSGTQQDTPAITSAYDWSRFALIADVGGGIGTQLVSILDAHPSCRGVLFDTPEVISKAISHARAERVAGDFLQTAPAGADAYLLRFVIHDWADAPAIAILRNVAKAMRPDSRLMIAEWVLPESAEASMGKWTDLHMMMLVGGRERTTMEFADLFRQAGLEIETIVPTARPVSLVVGRLA